MDGGSSGAASDAAIETLRTRGWCFGDLEQVKAMILIHSALFDDTRTVVDSVESELTNMDLKSISSRSLPDPHTLRKSSHLIGPKVLQRAWVRDVTRCGVEDFARNSNSWRLLKLGLTDGYSEDGAAVIGGLGTPRELGSRDLSNFLSSLSHTSVQHKPDVYAQTNIYDEHQRSQWAWCVCVVLC